MTSDPVAGAQLAAEGVTVGIVSGDSAACAAFYSDVLGLPALDPVRHSGMLVNRVQVGESRVNIVEFELSADERPVGRALGDRRGISYIALEVTDFEAVLERCREAGFPPLEGPKTPRPGVRMAMVSDPDGNLIEIVHRGGDD